MAGPPLTPAQTIGPFFDPAMLGEGALRNVLVQPETEGERIRIEGRVLDGDGVPIDDAMVEIWQANAYGRYCHAADQRDVPLDPSFTGYGRSGTDEEGHYWFETIKPGRVPFDEGEWQAPHISLIIFSRGLLNHVMTRLYFQDEPANGDDPILQLVPEHRQSTLIARREEVDGAAIYRLDIILQGDGETAFFNW